MVKIFVAQTHERERQLVSEFLKSAGHTVESSSTDPLAIMWLGRQMMFVAEPFALVTSQRDMFGCDYVSNLLHAFVLHAPVKTLTVVYSRAAAHQEHMPGAARYMADLVLRHKQAVEDMLSVDRHKLKILPKNDEPDKEMEFLEAYIDEFAPKVK